MRTKHSINIMDKLEKFYDLIYYDGPKLQVNIENNQILAWYDYKSDHEEWFLIYLEESSFIQYISNKFSLLNALEEGTVYSVKREYSDYDSIKSIEKITSLDGYELPDKDSYLGFDFADEIPYFGFSIKEYLASSKKYEYFEQSFSTEPANSSSTKLRYSKIHNKYSQIEISRWGGNNHEAA